MIPEKNALSLHGRHWIQVHSQNDSIRYNTKFLKKLLERLDTKECQNFRIFVHSVQQTLRELRKPKFKVGDRVRISTYGLPLRKGYKPQFTKEVFAIVAISSKKSPTYTTKDEQDEMNKMRKERCFLFISKLKSGDITTTGQYMNYQTFSSLQFKPLLKNFFHKTHIDLRDTSGEKLPSVSVGITRLVLMFRKTSSLHFLSKRRYKMVPSRHVEIPFYRGVGRQRGRGFSALAQVLARTAIPFLRKYYVPVAKRVGAELLEFAVPESAEVVSGRKNFQTAATSVGRQTMRKLLGSDSKKRSTSRVISTKSAKQISRSLRDIFTNLSH